VNISDISIKRKSYPSKAPTGRSIQRELWDVEWTQNGEVRHALFSTEDEARKYAITRLGYTG